MVFVETQPEKRILEGNRNIPQKMAAEKPDVEEENESKSNFVNRFPDLTVGDPRVKFNPFTGALYVLSYRYGSNDGTVKRRYSTYSDIDVATRGMSDILAKNNKQDGEVVVNTRHVVKTMQELLSGFRNGTINKENLEQISQDTIDRLSQAKFQNADKSLKQELVKQLTLATQPDSRGRWNPLISRTRIASAWLKTTRELFVAKMVREKYSYLYVVLSNERDLERFYLEQGVKAIENVVSGGKDDKELYNSLRYLEGFFGKFFSPEEIKANPYRQAAIETNTMLFGIRPQGREDRILRRYLGADKTEIVLDQTPITQIYSDNSLSSRERWSQISDRLKAAGNMLQDSLIFGEENFRTKKADKE